MKRFYQCISILLVLLLTLGCFAGCGGDAEDAKDDQGGKKPTANAADQNLGTYRMSVFDGTPVAEYAELFEISYEEARNSYTITLMEDGKATLYTDGESSDLTWTLDGEKFRIGDGGEFFEGTLKDGVITLDMIAVEIVYTKDEKETPPVPATDNAADPNLGTYRLSDLSGMSVADYAEYLEISYEEARNSFTVTLMEDGKAEMTSDGEVTKGTWTLDGEKFTLGEAGAEYEGTLKDGVMTIAIGGATFTFTTDEKEGPAAPVNTGATGDYDWWDGDWYGWWIIQDGTGMFEDYTGLFADAYAEIRVYGDIGSVELWDCFDGREARVAEAEIEFVEGDGENGYFYTSGGTFFPDGEMDGETVTPMELIYYDWVVDPVDSSVSHFEDMIEIIGYYTDPDNEENTFTYYVYLKPWGETWEDVRDGDTENCLYDDMMPYYYDDWYLPLLELGYTDGIVDFDEGMTIIEDGTYAPGYQPPDTGNTPAASLDPSDRFDGTGEVDMATLEKGLAWCKEETGYKTTYDEVAAQFGVHGKREMSEFYEDMVYYTWSCGDSYVKVAFKINDDGSETWNNTQYDGF